MECIVTTNDLWIITEILVIVTVIVVSVIATRFILNKYL